MKACTLRLNKGALKSKLAKVAQALATSPEIKTETTRSYPNATDASDRCEKRKELEQALEAAKSEYASTWTALTSSHHSSANVLEALKAYERATIAYKAAQDALAAMNAATVLDDAHVGLHEESIAAAAEANNMEKEAVAQSFVFGLSKADVMRDMVQRWKWTQLFLSRNALVAGGNDDEAFVDEGDDSDGTDSDLGCSSPDSEAEDEAIEAKDLERLRRVLRAYADANAVIEAQTLSLNGCVSAFRFASVDRAKEEMQAIDAVTKALQERSLAAMRISIAVSRLIRDAIDTLDTHLLAYSGEIDKKHLKPWYIDGTEVPPTFENAMKMDKRFELLHLAGCL
jgi:hypothetical protein